MTDIEEDLMEAQAQLAHWNDSVVRTFLTGANPFALHTEKLLEIASLVRNYFEKNRTIGCFARVTDIAHKTDEELDALRQAGYDGVTIGVETGDDEALQFMEKGYLAEEITAACRRLDRAEIRYHFFYLTGISGAGKGVEGARRTAEVFNRLHPVRIGASMLTVYPTSQLYQEILKGNWREESEMEKYRELQELVKSLQIPVWFGALGASNAIPISGNLPEDKPRILSLLDQIITRADEEALHHYRKNLKHL